MGLSPSVYQKGGARELGIRRMGLPRRLSGKESTCQSRRCRQLGKSPGGGNGNPFQYSYLENPMDSVAWRATVHGVTEGGMGLSIYGGWGREKFNTESTDSFSSAKERTYQVFSTVKTNNNQLEGPNSTQRERNGGLNLDNAYGNRYRRYYLSSCSQTFSEGISSL